MQRNGLMALLALAIAVAIAAIALSLGGGPGGTSGGTGDTVFAGLADRLGDVAALKIMGGASVTLQRRIAGGETQWVVAEKGGYPADPAKIRQTLLGFAELKLVEPKTSSPDSYKRLDVEDPGKEGGHARLVEIDDATGAKMGEVIVGKRRPDRLGTGADGLYIRKPSDAQSWLAQGSVDLPSEIKDWIDKKVAAIPATRIRQVTLTHEDGSTLVMKRDKEGDKFAVEGAPANAKFKSDAAVAEPAGVLDGFELNDVRPAADMVFPEQGGAQAEWVTFDGLTIVGRTIKKDDTNWVRLTASGEDKAAKEAADLNAKWSPWVWSVYEYKTNAMKTKLADLIEAPKGS